MLNQCLINYVIIYNLILEIPIFLYTVQVIKYYRKTLLNHI